MTQDIPTPTEVKARASQRRLELEILRATKHLGTDRHDAAIEMIVALNERLSNLDNPTKP